MADLADVFLVCSNIKQSKCREHYAHVIKSSNYIIIQKLRLSGHFPVQQSLVHTISKSLPTSVHVAFDKGWEFDCSSWILDSA